MVSVISASTSTAQASLELTITREELDTQAEALRFIHDSFILGSQSKDVSENPYAKLWSALIGHAIDESKADITNIPRVCSDLYDEGGFMKNRNTKKQFVINTRQLGNLKSDNIGKIIITATSTSTKGPFYPATTYPRILYGSSGLGSSSTNEDLYDQTENASDEIQRVEGIYIIAVKGDQNKIVSESGSSISEKTSYYDFYIRSCWMPPGVERASTVSTVVRLYDPAVITY